MTIVSRARLDEDSMAAIFTAARTHSDWQQRAVPNDLLISAYELARLGPTSANCNPMRITYLCSRGAKERLLPTLSKGNVRKVAAASCTAIIAQDRNYLDRVPMLFPAAYDVRSWFTATATSAADQGLRNTMLQAAYFIIAARALGLDCGPMSGFDAAAVDTEFLQGLGWTSVLLINVGYGIPESVEPRRPRLSAAEACRFF
jgi:3-hydroxypropanoate dehydrogenase